MIKYTEYKNQISFFENNVGPDELKKRYREKYEDLFFYGWFYVYKDAETDEIVLGYTRFKRKFNGIGHIDNLTREGDFDETVISFLDQANMEEVYGKFRCLAECEARDMYKKGKLKKVPSKYFTLFYD
jgi:hypothetical protein